MADFTKNITNTVNVFGAGPSTKWGQSIGYPYTMTWGTSTWGEGESLPYSFVKVITNSQDLTFEYAGGAVAKYVDLGSAPLDSDLGSEMLRDGTGNWNYVFPSNTAEGEDRSFATWTETTASDATFTCQAAAGTVWSES